MGTHEMLALEVVAGAVRLAVAAVFVLGAIHKLRKGAEFENTVAAYRLLPDVLTTPFAKLLPWLELTAAALLLWPGFVLIAVLPALALLLPMTLAVTINLLRGRTWIDCGCGGNKSEGLSWSLVVRNAVLMLLLLAAARPLTELDGLPLMLAAGLILGSIYFIVNQLSVNARRWRLINGGEGA